jgi:molybdopterin-containing oxidoreductase family iron-sulfur binding subunit
MVFGDLDDPASEVARLARDSHSFRILEKLGTEPKIYYRTARSWVRQAATQPRKESTHA